MIPAPITSEQGSVAVPESQGPSIEHSVHDEIATVVLNQPRRRNAMTLEMWEELGRVVRALDDKPAARVIVIRGAGHEAFSAGADISEFEALRSTAEKALDYNRRVGATLETLVHARTPLIAMIYGVCVGGGCELALTCDLRLAADNAIFGIPASRLGISVEMEDIKRLVDLVGPSNAKLILFTGNPRLPAARALQVGLVNELVRPDLLETVTYELAREITRAAPLSVRWAKEAVEAVLRDPDFSAMPDRGERAAALFATEDFREGARAFLEKRPPRFVGR